MKLMKLVAVSLFLVVLWTGSSGFAESFMTTSLTTINPLTNRNSQRPVLMSSSPEQDQNAPPQLPKTWNPLRLAVLRLGFTEPKMTSPFNYGSSYEYKDGVFQCAYCGNDLFDGTAFYDSDSGWPSFWRSSRDEAISYRRERDGRLECKCKRYDSHLGHVFLDGPKLKTVDATLLRKSPASDPRGRPGLRSARYLPRFCINGAALTYADKKS
jgi:peptide-methionine (R)-S-oxide reductase